VFEFGYGGVEVVCSSLLNYPATERNGPSVIKRALNRLRYGRLLGTGVAASTRLRSGISAPRKCSGSRSPLSPLVPSAAVLPAVAAKGTLCPSAVKAGPRSSYARTRSPCQAGSLLKSTYRVRWTVIPLVPSNGPRTRPRCRRMWR
jgi:hypothetical protein